MIMNNNHHPLIELAKSAILNYLAGRNTEMPHNIDPEYLNERAGVFVTIMKNGELRGCIGTCAPTKLNIAQEVATNAVAAAFDDPRFEPVSGEEIEQLNFEISIMKKPELVKDISGLNPKIFGILVIASGSGRSGLLLPDIKGVDSVERQLAIACKKGGIDPDKEKILIYKFMVKKIS